ncbi:peptidylprolyl isomerase [Luminiphilus sp. nBUS_07]|uniref:peptidylprolyl isomerase n=1 Tax=Luminiphilus sp. nBUS_07 TaxID=3395314 RepID=UPI003EBE447F
MNSSVNFVSGVSKYVGGVLCVVLTSLVTLSSIASDDSAIAAYDGLSIGAKELAFIVKYAPPSVQQEVKVNPAARYELLANAIVTKRIFRQLETLNKGADQDDYLRLQFKILELAREFDRKLFQRDLVIPNFDAVAEERYRTTGKDIARKPETRLLSHILLLCTEQCDVEIKQAELTRLRDRLIAGESFSDLAAEFSQDPGSRQRGGRLSRPIALEDVGVDETFRETAFSLSEAGDISEIVRSQFGFHIMRLEKVNPSRLYTFEEAKPALLKEIEQRFRQDAYKAYFLSLGPGDEMEIDYQALESLLGPLIDS